MELEPMKKKAALNQETEPMKKIKAEIPRKLYDQMDRLVKEGWFRSHEAIIDDALRRFLNSHRPEIMERHILEDVEQALRGGK
jgi:Arc/MetJ-type ribon-helix-helix transcriptional regulator